MILTRVCIHPVDLAHSVLCNQTCLSLSCNSSLVNLSPSQLKFWKPCLTLPVWPQSYFTNAIRRLCPRVPKIFLFPGSLGQTLWLRAKHLGQWLIWKCPLWSIRDKQKAIDKSLKIAIVNILLIIFKSENFDDSLLKKKYNW